MRKTTVRPSRYTSRRLRRSLTIEKDSEPRELMRLRGCDLILNPGGSPRASSKPPEILPDLTCSKETPRLAITQSNRYRPWRLQIIGDRRRFEENRNQVVATGATESLISLNRAGGSGTTTRLGPDLAIPLRVGHHFLYLASSEQVQWPGIAQISVRTSEKCHAPYSSPFSPRHNRGD